MPDRESDPEKKNPSDSSTSEAMEPRPQSPLSTFMQDPFAFLNSIPPLQNFQVDSNDFNDDPNYVSLLRSTRNRNDHSPDVPSNLRYQEVYADAPPRIAKRRKSGLQEYGSKQRFVWDDDLHKLFLLAIFDLGLERSKPLLIENRLDKYELPQDFSLNQVRRNLGKYRGKLQRSHRAFRANCDISMADASANADESKGNKAGNVSFHVYPFHQSPQNFVSLFDSHDSQSSESDQ